MNYIVTALDAEARILIDHYRLKKVSPLPYTLYGNEETTLLVSGIGKVNALMAVSALLGWRRPQANDVFLNIGVCGAPGEYEIGEPLLIHQIIDTNRRYYPDILYTHPLREASIVCADEPQSIPCDFPVDMESSAVFQAASRFVKLHQMGFIKIVSDHFSPQNVTKEGVTELIRSNVNKIDEVRSALEKGQLSEKLFSEGEHHEIETLKSWFTKAQACALEDALSYFRLKYPQEVLPIRTEIPHSKRERSRLLEELIAKLTT